MDAAQLEMRLRKVLGARHPVAAGAVITPDGTTTASVGAAAESEFEIGSVSKGVTGLLYAVALERGEVSESTRLGELLPLEECPAAGVTLGSLARHHSGLPSVPLTGENVRRTVGMIWKGANPYGDSLKELLDSARGVRLRKPRFRYSNLGFQLLGHALASAAGDVAYPELVRARVAEPLGIATFTAPSSVAELGENALPGRGSGGKPHDAWTGEALAPAGGIRATIGDFARLASALADGSAPGIGALDPVAKAGAMEIGAAWITLEHQGRRVTWHNGMTGGFASWMGVDREAGCAVALLTATARVVDRHGFDLLAEVVEGRGGSHGGAGR
ncbi:MAG: serine hydrolase [bacterium]|nr:serine hydrolase [bacterium]